MNGKSKCNIDLQISSSDEEIAIIPTSSCSQRKRKKKETSLQKQEKIILPAQETMSLSAQETMPQKEEEWEVYGRSIGFQIKELNKRQLMITQKIISDVIFYAKLNKLNESSYVVLNPSNQPKFTQFYSPSPLSHYSSPSPSHEQN